MPKNMLRLFAMLSIGFGAVFFHLGDVTAASPKLKGDYAFTGASTCLAVGWNGNPDPGFSGFDDDLQIKDHRRSFATSFTVYGIRTFNGDGTGHVVATAVSTSFDHNDTRTTPDSFSVGTASSSDITTDFEYTVEHDGSITTKTTNYNGTITSGARQGQTVTIELLEQPAGETDVAFEFVGKASVNNQTLTLSTPRPVVEVQTITDQDGNVSRRQRICHRSRVLIWMGN